MKVTVLMVMTLDGKTAKNSDQPNSSWISKADAKLFRDKTKAAGVIIMGNNTYQTIGRHLPSRLNIVITNEPESQVAIPDQLEFTNDEPGKILRNLKSRNFKEVIICGGAEINSLFLLDDLIDELWLTIEPKLFGRGLGLFNRMDLDQNLELITDPERLGVNSVLLKYRVIK